MRVRITGRVQGVGYRAWMAGRAQELCLNGWVRNDPDGCVVAVLSGRQNDVENMLDECRAGPPTAEVEDVSGDPFADTPDRGFEIR